MRSLVLLGELDGDFHFYYPAIAQELYVGYTTSQGGLGFPAVNIQYAPEDLPGVLRVVRHMESQGRLPQVFLEKARDRRQPHVANSPFVRREISGRSWESRKWPKSRASGNSRNRCGLERY
jgi:hypothetical protein